MSDEYHPIEPDDIAPELEARHREIMLDLVLAWGTLDGALGMMLSRVIGVPLTEGADIVSKMPSSTKFQEMIKLLRDHDGGSEAAAELKRNKKAYERYSKTRNYIAHAHCAGFWIRDPDYVVFAVFERVNGDNLVVDRVPLEQMAAATIWGKAMASAALKIVDMPFSAIQPNNDDPE